jgi:Type VI secretion system/phage-baseplate injector OB domain
VSARFFGVYRGKVESNLDPLQRGRVQVSVPEIFDDGRLAWAEPCRGYAGNGVGGFALPPVGTATWIQFERGDPNFPVLAGVGWKRGESPTPGLEQIKMLKTDTVTITVSDVPGAGGVTVEVEPPAVAMPIKLALGSAGIELSVGASSVKLDGVNVSVNDGALQVT